jgi:adenylate kinase
LTPLQQQIRAAWLGGVPARLEANASGTYLPWRIILLGAPGVGKGTQADLLHERLDTCHLSTGEVFRAAGSRCDAEQSPAMKEALTYMRRGELVPDSTVWDMIRERSQCLQGTSGFILDGFPRTLAQAVLLKQLLDDQGLALSAVIHYQLATDAIVARLGGRRNCLGCKAVYHVTERPAKTPGRCDRCQEELVQREDDRPESIQVRLEAYQRSTQPLIDFYRKSGLLLEVAAEGTPLEICQKTLPELEHRRHRQAARLLWSAEENRR